MKIEIGTEQFATAERFMSNTNCPLAVALKKLFPGEEIKVGATNVDVGSKTNREFTGWSENGHFAAKVDYLIKCARLGDETPTFIVDIPGLELREEVIIPIEELCYSV